MSKSNRKTHGRTARVERAGVLHCARVVNEMKRIWRERPISDVGIDGDIEIVEPATETPTGRFLFVQGQRRERSIRTHRGTSSSGARPRTWSIG